MSYLIPSKHDGWVQGKRHLNMGGGGSGGQTQRDATPEERALWAAQGDALTQMTNASMPAVTTGFNNLGKMANEASDGTLRDRTMGYVGDYGKGVNAGIDTYGQGVNAGLDTYEKGMDGIYDAYGAARKSATSADVADSEARDAGIRGRQALATGTNPNSGRFAGIERAAGVMSAANRAGALNGVNKDLLEKQMALKADVTGKRLSASTDLASKKLGASGDLAKIGLDANSALENTAWDRTSSLLNSAAHTSGSAVSGLSGLSSSLSQNRQAGNAADAASANGYGMAGAYLGSKLFAKDGGMVKVEESGEAHLASGGSLERFKTDGAAWNPISLNLSGAGGSGRRGISTMDKIGAVGLPMAMQFGAKVLGDEVVKPWMKSTFNPAVTSAKESFKAAFNGTPAPGTSVGQEGLKNSFSGSGSAEATAQLADDAKMAQIPSAQATAPDASSFGEAANPNLLSGEVGKAQAASGTQSVPGMAEAASGAVEPATSIAMEAAPATAAEAGIGEAAVSAAAEAALPAVAAETTAAELLPLIFLKAGGIARKNFIPGGKVSGPGTETSDSIPARLSDGEYVLNAEAVKMIGKDKLDAMNQAGLTQRGEVHAADGEYIEVGRDENNVPIMEQQKAPAPNPAPKKEPIPKELTGLDKVARLFGVSTSINKKMGGLRDAANYANGGLACSRRGA